MLPGSRPCARAAVGALSMMRSAHPSRSVHVDVSSLRGKHLDSLFSLSGAEMSALLDLSSALKASLRRGGAGAGGRGGYAPLRGRSLAMLFQKRSTRTRVSTEAGFAMLGGHPLFLGSEDIQLGKNESLRDTARVLSRFNDGILARVYGHADIEGLCAEASVPVINALSDREHPLQGLADMLTMREAFGALRGLTVAWVGDGNNVCATLLSAAPAMGFDVQVATPPGYGVAPALLARATAAAAAAGTRIAVGADPRAALAGAHVVATDTWVSMGQEAEKAARQAAFAGFQVTERLAADAGAHPEWRFLHCLPRKPDEVDDEVFYSPRRSLVWDEAENRMWTVMAVLLAQMDGGAAVPA